MKKLIMFVMVLAIATPAVALKYSDDAPNFAGCPGSASVFWEFTEDGCMPTTDIPDIDPWYYDPDPAIPPVFGSRHWDDPTNDSGWGGSYGADPWTWANGAYTILAEDSFNQSVPERGEDIYLRQYFQIVHTMVPGLPEDDYRWPIGLGLELWDMSVYQENGWTGCPVGYEGLDGDGYRDGYEHVPPDIHYQIDPPNGIWYKSIWVHDFSEDGTVYTSATEASFPDLFEATHTACIIGMDFVPEAGQTFMVEEATLDFIWFSMPDRSDIPSSICFRPGATAPPIKYSTFHLPIYEPMDVQVVGPPAINGPEPMGPTSGELRVHLAWQPSYIDSNDLSPTYGDEIDYDTFNVTVVVDPDPNDNNPHEDYIFPDSTEPNGWVTLTFTELDFTDDHPVTITAIGDADIEGNETHTIEFTITADVDDPNFGGPGHDPVVVTKRVVVVDNDIPFVAADPFEFNLSEQKPDDPCCFEVRLSHKPADGATVYVYVAVDGPEDTIIIDPNFVQHPPYFSEPNRLTFTAIDWQDPCSATMTSGWHMPQTICVYAHDNDILVEEGLRYPQGEIILTPFSKDERYLVDFLDPSGLTVVQDPCIPGDETSGGIGVETFLEVIVEDNECGARGYNPADVAGGEDGGPDCWVNLADLAAMFQQWLMCTYPFDGDVPLVYTNKWDECSPLWLLFEEEE